jgi:hypothetical protein
MFGKYFTDLTPINEFNLLKVLNLFTRVNDKIFGFWEQFL